MSVRLSEILDWTDMERQNLIVVVVKKGLQQDLNCLFALSVKVGHYLIAVVVEGEQPEQVRVSLEKNQCCCECTGGPHNSR